MIVQKVDNFWQLLSINAWNVRENAYILGKTKVGCSLYSTNRKLFSGCNVEHKYRSHDIHAEVNAISTMIAAGETIIDSLLVVAERDFFTPCGSCMDWIMQFATENTQVGFQNNPNGEITVFNVFELMPHYPK